MANYYATARSNYFKVKDIKAFKRAIYNMAPGVQVHEKADNVVMLDACNFTDNGAWPTSRWVDDSNDADESIGHDEPINYAEIIAPHLVEGQVAVMLEVGNEKLRYVCGYARAIYSDGREITLSLDDIYERAANKFGVPIGNISSASY